jgi:predicted TIM-barrel enzyme
VHSDNSQWTKKAKEILERTGAEDVSSTGEATGEKRDSTQVREVA